MKFRLPKIYPITDAALTGLSHLKQVEKLVEAGATFIQLREKRASPKEFYEAVNEVMQFTKGKDVKIIVNDRVDIALAARADGVHLGQEDLLPRFAREILGEKSIIGFSTHNLAQAIEAVKLPVDYIAAGPVFSTLTKENPDPVLSLKGLRKLREAVGNFPLVAIGGINFENAREVFANGADSIAVISALLAPATGISKNFIQFRRPSDYNKVYGQLMNTAKVSYTNRRLALEDFENEVWQQASAVNINKYWSGAEAETQRRAEARLIWTDEAFLFRFDCNQSEPLVISSEPNLENKTIGLWERDVCEIFVAPEKIERYFEFEVAPTGEWLDAAVRQTPEGRETDFEYNSGMKTAALVKENRILLAMQIEWKAFGRKPAAGERWRGNLFRCVGSGRARGYLAWQPTRTTEPNFHVPGAFGYFEFVR